MRSAARVSRSQAVFCRQRTGRAGDDGRRNLSDRASTIPRKARSQLTNSCLGCCHRVSLRKRVGRRHAFRRSTFEEDLVGGNVAATKGGTMVPRPLSVFGNFVRVLVTADVDSSRPFSSTLENQMSQRTLAGAVMHLDGKIPAGYVALCATNGETHSFVVRRLGPSVECPQCGHTALSANLIAAYYERLADQVIARNRPGES